MPGWLYGPGGGAPGTGQSESCAVQVIAARSPSTGSARVGRLRAGKAPGSHATRWPPGDPLSFPFAAANPLLCSTARYHCKNGLCIDKSFICDGQNNCQDNSDEESCESSQGRGRGPGGERPPAHAEGHAGASTCFSGERSPPRFLQRGRAPAAWRPVSVPCGGPPDRRLLGPSSCFFAVNPLFGIISSGGRGRGSRLRLPRSPVE